MDWLSHPHDIICLSSPDNRTVSLDLHRPDAVRILDFPHAAEHAAAMLQALEKAGLIFPAEMLQRCVHSLKHRGPRPLLGMVNRLPTHLSELQGVREHLGYLRKREALMQYPEFRQQGWPIGSGMVGEWGECQQTRRRSSSEGGRHALGTNSRQSHAGFT